MRPGKLTCGTVITNREEIRIPRITGDRTKGEIHELCISITYTIKVISDHAIEVEMMFPNVTIRRKFNSVRYAKAICNGASWSFRAELRRILGIDKACMNAQFEKGILCDEFLIDEDQSDEKNVTIIHPVSIFIERLQNIPLIKFNIITVIPRESLVDGQLPNLELYNKFIEKTFEVLNKLEGTEPFTDVIQVGPSGSISHDIEEVWS